MVFDYPARDEVELRLRWPEGWSLDQRPRPAAFDGPCGALSTAQVVDAEKRTLVYRRRFDITRRRLNTKDEYEAVRGLFGEAAKNDAQKLTLVRRYGEPGVAAARPGADEDPHRGRQEQ